MKHSEFYLILTHTQIVPLYSRNGHNPAAFLSPHRAARSFRWRCKPGTLPDYHSLAHSRRYPAPSWIVQSYTTYPTSHKSQSLHIVDRHRRQPRYDCPFDQKQHGHDYAGGCGGVLPSTGHFQHSTPTNNVQSWTVRRYHLVRPHSSHLMKEQRA